MKMQTIGEYVAKHGKNFFVYDERIDDYLFDGDTIDTDGEEWKTAKDEKIVGIDEVTNEFFTLIIHTIEEETEEEGKSCLEFDSEEEYNAYWGHLERDQRNAED